MSKFVFSPAQRYAIYKTFNQTCQWCKEPVDFANFQADHVIPESLLFDLDKLKRVKESYGLDNSFNINDYENWAPMHGRCNRKKSASSWESLPIIKNILDDCAKNKPEEKKIELKLSLDVQKSKFLATIQTAMEENFLNIQQLQNLLTQTNIVDMKDADLDALKAELDEKMDYQVQKMTYSIMGIVRENVLNAVQSIATELGADWNVTHPMARYDGKFLYKMEYILNNRVDGKYSCRLAILPTLSEKKLLVSFSENDVQIDEMNLDVEKGIDWVAFGNKVKELYKSSFEKKVKGN